MNDSQFLEIANHHSWYLIIYEIQKFGQLIWDFSKSLLKVMAAGAVRARPRKFEPTTAQTAIMRSWAKI